jgi:5-methylcytosine-specific restriction endonuclease McrA
MARPNNWMRKGERIRLRRELFARQGGLCYLCGSAMSITVDWRRDGWGMLATFDHLKPMADGGASDRSNLKLAHHSCNSTRGRQNVVGVPLVLRRA